MRLRKRKGKKKEIQIKEKSMGIQIRKNIIWNILKKQKRDKKRG